MVIKLFRDFIWYLAEDIVEVEVGLNVNFCDI